MQPASSAALLFGTAAHALDFDDYELIASTHPSAVIVSALLAMVEQCNAAHEPGPAGKQVLRLWRNKRDRQSYHVRGSIRTGRAG
jgi:2-methylcitrate dehydratase PrpD